MTKKLFWTNPYLTELQTEITGVNGNQVTLAETIFYAFSGGQESDSGTIEGYLVEIATKVGLDIFYTLDADSLSLKVGDSVVVKIDWDRRYRLMRLHFAAEIVLELVCHHFPEIVKVGAHIGEQKARIDFEWTDSLSPLITHFEEQSQSIIDSDQDIISAFSDERSERRYWKVKEFSQVPCGGTHIKKTKEVGSIKLKRANPGKGRERIEIYVS